MSDGDFEVKGLEKLIGNLDEILDTFSGTAEKGLITIGNRLKKTCQTNTPEGATGKLKKGWKHTVRGYNGQDLVYELRNTHAVHHLLNNGHVKKTPSGRVVGYYEGQHYTEKSVKQFTSNDLRPSLEKLVKTLTKKAGGA